MRLYNTVLQFASSFIQTSTLEAIVSRIFYGFYLFNS